ncbi:MAG: hypothetical protein L0H84_19110, partial [Pseudonocardia sp.]|nr:hypothetical protein [Pseudonocardia sp.]
RFLGGLGGVAALTACGTPTQTRAPRPDGWQFTDDRGVTVTLPARPTRVAAYHAPAAALISFGVRPVAAFGGGGFAASEVLEGIDMAGVASAGETYGQVDLETLLAHGTELIITAYDPNQTGPAFGFTDEAAQAQAQRVAPIVAINGVADPAAVIRRFADLAAALGADLAAPAVVADRQRFDTARDAVRSATSAAPWLTAVAIVAFDAGVYFVRPRNSPNTRQLLDLGLRLVEPRSPATDVNTDFRGHFYEAASFEELGRYPADLIVLDRTDPATLAGIATWAALPAVQAGQLAQSSSLIRWTYRQQGEELESVAAAVRAARDVVP